MTEAPKTLRDEAPVSELYALIAEWAVSKGAENLADKPGVWRGECVGYALAAYAAERGTRLADLTDILTDLLHFADQGGEDCEALVRNALWNWRNER